MVHVGELRKQLVEDLGLECRLGGTPLSLVGNGLGLGDALRTGGLDRSKHLGGVVARDLVGHDLRRTHGGYELLLEFDGLADELLGELQASSQDGLVDHRGAGFVDVASGFGTASLDHHHRDVAVVQQAAGHDHLEGRLATFLVGGMRNPLAGRCPGNAHRTDRAVERDAGQHQGCRGAVQGQYVVGVLHVGTNDGAHDVDLVAEAVREHRPQWAIDEATGQNRRFRCPAFTTEERAGNLAGGVHPLLDVDRKWEEVRTRSGGLRSGGGHQDRGTADLGQDGSAGETGHTARLERHCLIGPAECAGNRGCFSHASLFS